MRPPSKPASTKAIAGVIGTVFGLFGLGLVAGGIIYGLL
jgi:hypothetical protein